MEGKSLLFVAGDGASGRILCEAEQRLRADFPGRTRVLVQEGGGAAGLCRSEGRPHHVIRKDEARDALDVYMDEVALVVVAHSGTAYEVEVAANLAAFDCRIPCLRVFDHPLGSRHEYFRTVMREWVRKDRPPFRVAAITTSHAEALAELYPELRDHIRVIGNALHVKLETLLAEGREAVQTRLRLQHQLPFEKRVIAAYLSGNNDATFIESLNASDAMARVLARTGECVVVDVHFVNQDQQRLCEDRFSKWRALGATVVTGIPHDEMIALCDALIASSTSSVCERALANGIPVIQHFGAGERAEIEKMTGRTFPAFTPELERGAVLWANETFRTLDWEDTLNAAFDPLKQVQRNVLAAACGTVPEPGAMGRLLSLIRELSTSQNG